MSAKLFRAAVVFCGLLLIWWLVTRSGIPAFLLPSPSAVASALWVNRAYLGGHTLITLSEILSGLALGVLLGVILALCMIVSPRLQRWLMPLVLTSQAIPVFACGWRPPSRPSGRLSANGSVQPKDWATSCLTPMPVCKPISALQPCLFWCY